MTQLNAANFIDIKLYVDKYDEQKLYVEKYLTVGLFELRYDRKMKVVANNSSSASLYLV